MTVVFGIKDEDGWFTADPELVAGSRLIKSGDYIRLPNGHVYLYGYGDFVSFTRVEGRNIPIGTQVLEAKAYDVVAGCLE
jgi:hypothetical protein